MILGLLLAAGLAWWLHREGVLVPALRRWGLAAVLALAAARLLEGGNLVLAGAAAAGAVAVWFGSRPRAARSGDEAEARAVLGVGADDDARAINAAWRRVIAQVHPDKGGTADLARRVTAARDLLLARTPR